MLTPESKEAVQALLAARSAGTTVKAHQVNPADADTAYAIQDATAAALGAIGGWKVGSGGAGTTPTCAPLPASGLLASGAVLSGPAWRVRGIEVEVALRVCLDLLPDGPPVPVAMLPGCFDAVLPVIEVVESRFEDRASASVLGKLADLQSHGALILGTPQPLRPAELKLKDIVAHLEISGQAPLRVVGGNTAEDLWKMLSWFVELSRKQGRIIRAGQIITTGTLTGMPLASAGAKVQASIDGLGPVSLSFA